jgi:hypothetical protein
VLPTLVYAGLVTAYLFGQYAHLTDENPALVETEAVPIPVR